MYVSSKEINIFDLLLLTLLSYILECDWPIRLLYVLLPMFLWMSFSASSILSIKEIESINVCD